MKEKKTIGDEIDEFMEIYKHSDDKWRRALEAEMFLERFKWGEISKKIKALQMEESMEEYERTDEWEA